MPPFLGAFVESLPLEEIDKRLHRLCCLPVRGPELFGEDGVFDSMGLVSLIVAVEQEIEDRFGKAVALADERALSRSSSPYRTVETLAYYAAENATAA